MYLDMKQAYNLLGLEEGASEEELEARYSLLIRRKKNRSEEADRAAGELTLSEINAAYRFIKNAAIEAEVRSKEPKSKWARRYEYIYDYYKWPIVITILVILAGFYAVTSIMDSKSEERRIARADLKVALFVDYQVQDTEKFRTQLMEGMKEYKDVYVLNQYAPLEPTNEFASAMLQKTFILMAADESDLYIMDKGNFAKFGTQGPFIPLNEQPALAQVPAEKRRTLEVDQAGSQWIGIDIGQSPVVKSLGLPPGEWIGAIRVNGSKKDNAVKTLSWLAAP